MYITRSLDRDDDPTSLRPRLATYCDQLELAHHDIDTLLKRDDRFRRRLLRHLDAGRIAQARAMVLWHLQHQHGG